MRPKRVHFGPQKRVLEPPISSRLPLSFGAWFRSFILSRLGVSRRSNLESFWHASWMYPDAQIRFFSVPGPFQATIACFWVLRWSLGLILEQFGMLFGRRELNFWVLEQGNSECVRACVRMVRVCAGVYVCVFVCTCVSIGVRAQQYLLQCICALVRVCVRACVCVRMRVCHASAEACGRNGRPRVQRPRFSDRARGRHAGKVQC